MLTFPQAMSASAAKVLKQIGTEETAETTNFVDIVDKLFDCLNVSSMSKGRHQRKALLNHIISQMTSTTYIILYSNILNKCFWQFL